MQSGISQIYHQGTLTFILTPEKVIIMTSLPQTFYLEPKQHYWVRRLNLIRRMIEIDEIRNLEELSEWCSRGIAWIPTSKNYLLDKSVQKT